MEYGQSVRKGDISFELRRSGHVVGGATVLAEGGGKRIFYTGDIKVPGSRLLQEADLDIGEIDLLITESTYSQTEQVPREESERGLVEFANETNRQQGGALRALVLGGAGAGDALHTQGRRVQAPHHNGRHGPEGQRDTAEASPVPPGPGHLPGRRRVGRLGAAPRGPQEADKGALRGDIAGGDAGGGQRRLLPSGAGHRQKKRHSHGLVPGRGHPRPPAARRGKGLVPGKRPHRHRRGAAVPVLGAL